MGEDGSISYKAPNKGALYSTLVSTGFGAAGAGIGGGFSNTSLGKGIVSTTFNALGSGFRFNDDGSAGAYDWGKAGISFAANMASTVAGLHGRSQNDEFQEKFRDFRSANRSMNGLGPAFPEFRRFAVAPKIRIWRPAAQPLRGTYVATEMYNDGLTRLGGKATEADLKVLDSNTSLMGQQVGRAANVLTASLLGDRNAVNAYMPQGLGSAIGTYLGDRLAQHVNTQGAPATPATPANNGQPVRELIGGGAIMTGRREREFDFLGGLLDAGQAIGGAGAAVGSGLGSLAAGAWSGAKDAANWGFNKLVDGLDYTLDKIIRMPEMLASLPSALMSQLTGGRLGTSLDVSLKNSFGGMALQPFPVVSGGQTLTIPAAQKAGIMSALLGRTHDTEYSIFEHRGGKVQIRNTSSRETLTKNEMTLINKLDTFTDKDGNEYKRVQFVDKANGVDLPQNIAVFEGPNGTKMMIMKDGSVIQSVKDNAGKITNKLWTANGQEKAWTLNANSAKGAAVVNYSETRNRQGIITSRGTVVSGVRYNFGPTDPVGNGLVFEDFALDPGQYGPRQGGEFDKQWKGTSGELWLNMTQVGLQQGVTEYGVFALNYGNHNGSLSHARGKGMDLTSLSSTTLGNINFSHTGFESRSMREAMQTFNNAVKNHVSGAVDIYTSLRMHGESYPGSEWVDNALANTRYVRPRRENNPYPSAPQIAALKANSFAQQVQTMQSNGATPEAIDDFIRRQARTTKYSLMNEHLTHEHISFH
ncbi:hypothetical protein Turpa_1512 [Turneriella parva DSM 21527]|uniref:Uncharacterized protein n=2 Tax=Turneriella TaxID=338321 RepID=I4B4F3_TURPD|nr:hypothetical protein Turpa_1512 [Turneriella parva DSM 21527]